MKLEFNTVAAKYAEALLELAFKAGDTIADTILADLQSVNKLFAATTDLSLIFGHPAIPLAAKRKLLIELVGGSVQDLTLRLIELLLDKRRLALLPLIETQYHAIMNKRKNVISASLTCAEALSDNSVADIKARLAEHLGSHLELHVKIDRSLIGGLILRLGDQVIDGSLRGKLQNLERVLLSV